MLIIVGLSRYIKHTLASLVILTAGVLLTSCSSTPMLSTNIPAEIPTPVITATPYQPETISLYLSSGFPQSWKGALEHINSLPLADELPSASLAISQGFPTENELEYANFTKIFAAVVPFPTVNDTITMDEIEGLWNGAQDDTFNELLMSSETDKVFQELWGKDHSAVVRIMEQGDLLDAAWGSLTTLAIVPFEEISPRWKVLKINGISPLDKPMNTGDYPLTITYHLVGKNTEDPLAQSIIGKISEALPVTNRDESKMTVVAMSGTTALVRTTAYKIEQQGVMYPISEIKKWFLSADIRHVSNEISINKDCPDPNPWTTSLRFCTKEEYLPALVGLGINVIELTGNHLNDYGPEKLAETIAIYKKNQMETFGGGVNLEEAQKPLELLNNGNMIALIGCNFVGPKSDFATETAAGSAPCDLEKYTNEIRRLKNEGYVVFATFQHNEVYVYMYDVAYQTEFHAAAEAGADIVQGSQAHFPMGFEFSGNSLIHYGLGNLLFDQMDYPVIGTRREFVDRHIVYNGKYINTELLTAYLTDWSKPIPMTNAQRNQFLTDIFKASKMR